MPEIDSCSSGILKPLRKGFDHPEGRIKWAHGEQEESADGRSNGGDRVTCRGLSAAKGGEKPVSLTTGSEEFGSV